MYKSVAFSTLTLLILAHFHHPQKKPCTGVAVAPISHSPAPGTV